MSTKVMGADRVAGARWRGRWSAVLVAVLLAAAISILAIQAGSISSARHGAGIDTGRGGVELVRPRGGNVLGALNPPGRDRGQVRFGPLEKPDMARPHLPAPHKRRKWGST
jgi:hypothetical protein